MIAVGADDKKYLRLLLGELGLEEADFPPDRDSQLTLIIAEIVRNAMYSLFILEPNEDETLPSTSSLNHFVRNKAEAVLSGAFSSEEIENKINALLKHNDRQKEDWYSANLYDLGQILYVRPGRIEYAPVRIVEHKFLPQPLLISSWPTRVIRQMGMQVSLMRLTRSVSSSSITEFKDIESQSLQDYCDPPPLWKIASKKKSDLDRATEILRNLSTKMKFPKWENEVQDYDIALFDREYGKLRWRDPGGHDILKIIKYPTKKFPFEGINNYWAIFKTTREDRYDRQPAFWLFISGSSNYRWENGSVCKIPSELIRYVVRLFAGRPKIKILDQEREGFSRFSVGGAPPHAGRRLLHSLGATSKLLPGTPLTYEIKSIYRDPVIKLLCSDFLYELEEGS